MYIELHQNKATAVIRREPADPKVYTDSAFFYAVRNCLRAMEHDVIKKLMCKDGHLTSEHAYYVRSRRCRTGQEAGTFALVWSRDLIEPAYPYYNQGQVTLQAYWGFLKRRKRR